MINNFEKQLIEQIVASGVLLDPKAIERVAHLQMEYLEMEIFKQNVKAEIGGGSIVAFSGGAYVEKDTVAYNSAVLLGKLLAQNSIASISGGGPGIMTACLEGAEQGGMPSIAIKLNGIPSEDKKKEANLEVFTDNIAPRQSAILDIADVHIFCSGGLGTLYEFGESATMNKILKYPKPKLMILLDEASEAPYWQKLNQLGEQFLDKGMVYLPTETALLQIEADLGYNPVLEQVRELYKEKPVLPSPAIDLLAKEYGVTREKICGELWDSFVINSKIGQEQQTLELILSWLAKNR